MVRNPLVTSVVSGDHLTVRLLDAARLAIAAALLSASAARAAAPIDRGIFPDLDAKVAISFPGRDEIRAPRLGIAPRTHVLVLYDGDYPLAAFALPAKAPPS